MTLPEQLQPLELAPLLEQPRGLLRACLLEPGELALGRAKPAPAGLEIGAEQASARQVDRGPPLALGLGVPVRDPTAQGLDRRIERRERAPLPLDLEAGEAGQNRHRVHLLYRSTLVRPAGAPPTAAASRAKSSASVLRSPTSWASRASSAGRAAIASSIRGSLPAR